MIRSSELVSESAWSSALFMSETVVALGVVEDVSRRQRIASVLDGVWERVGSGYCLLAGVSRDGGGGSVASSGGVVSVCVGVSGGVAEVGVCGVVIELVSIGKHMVLEKMVGHVWVSSTRWDVLVY